MAAEKIRAHSLKYMKDNQGERNVVTTFPFPCYIKKPLFHSENTVFISFQGRGGGKMKKDYWNMVSPYIIWFTLYAFIGWCYEVFLEVVVYRWGFSNRGVLFGPYLPVYGFGAMIFLALVYPMIKEKPFRKRMMLIPLVFLLCMLSATALELLTSYVLEFFLGSWPWQTYKDYKYNFQARIALSPSVRFGLGGLLFLYILQPLFEKLTDRLGEAWVKKAAFFLLVMYAVDVLYSILLR